MQIQLNLLSYCFTDLFDWEKHALCKEVAVDHSFCFIILPSHHIHRDARLLFHNNVWTRLPSISQFLPPLHMTHFDQDSIPWAEDLTPCFLVIVLFLLSLSMPRYLVGLGIGL